MGEYLNQALFGIYPYIALSIFLIGSLVRFDTDQYGWRSKSSQLLRRRQLVWGSILFHVGIIGILLGTLGAEIAHRAYPALPTRTTMWSVVIAFLFSFAVGIFFGVYPAKKAADLDPIEALRYE